MNNSNFNTLASNIEDYFKTESQKYKLQSSSILSPRPNFTSNRQGKLTKIDFSKYNRVYKKVATYFTWMSREITQKKTSTLKKRTFPEIF